MLSKFVLGLFSIFLLLNVNQALAQEIEESPVITINFVSGNIIDLDKDSQMIRADVQIQNYDPQDGYHFMQIIRLSDGEILKDTEILPKHIEDNLYGVKILHYLDPDNSEEIQLGDYGLRIYSEFGTSEAISNFSIIRSGMPPIISQNNEQLVEPLVAEPVESVVEESKIPPWVHDIFVWYADDVISENELLSALEYLISQGVLNVEPT